MLRVIPAEPRVAFRAETTAQTSVASGGSGTKINLSSEVSDTAGCFDPSTSRFTPSVAGYYVFTAAVSNNGVNTAIYAGIKKNNATNIVYNSYPAVGTGVFGYMSLSTIAFMNGTTDYVELWMQQYSGSTQSIGHGGSLAGALMVRA